VSPAAEVSRGAEAPSDRYRGWRVSKVYHRRDLLTRLDLVFMDTTSLYFEGAGGQTLGKHGYSKDHRPDLRQMILAVGTAIRGPRRAERFLSAVSQRVT
jgi:hypothetical protein